MKVKCITNNFLSFTNGKCYEVVTDYTKSYELVNNLGMRLIVDKSGFEVIKEEKQMSQEFRNMKIRINSPEHSKKV